MSFASALRNARADQFGVFTDAGPAAGLIRVYDGVRPAAGGAATTLLAELTFSDPSFSAAAAGVATANAITQDASANASGTATWFRVVDSVGTFVTDGDIGLAGADMNVNTTAVAAGQPFAVTSFVLTEGNP